MSVDARINSLPPLKEVIAAHNLSAQKSLGQNFLLDLNITDKISRFAFDGLRDAPNTHLFEIGPGPGGLTRSLLKLGTKQVSAVEFDPRAVEALQDLQEAAEKRLDVLHADALEIDLCSLGHAPRAIVANLPYNIATPLLIGWLRQIRADVSAYESMTLMFQKEVGQRIAAQPNSKAYGRLAVITGWLCHARIVYDLPPSAFTPPPKVMSCVVQFIPKKPQADAPQFKTVEMVTASAFNQRRKMIRQSLKPYMAVLEELGIETTLRAENLSVADYINIAEMVDRP